MISIEGVFEDVRRLMGPPAAELIFGVNS